MPYHQTSIEPGVLGFFSKIREEFTEAEDANNQKCSVMELVELSDLIGAIEAYTLKNFNLGIEDLKKFSDITKSAFQDGTRTPKSQ